MLIWKKQDSLANNIMVTASTLERAQASRRWKRRWIILVLLFIIPFSFILFAYVATWYTGTARLDRAFAEADQFDPGWRFEEIETKRLPFPKPDKNGIDQVLRIKAAMPKSLWPEWPFPDFDPIKDRGYLEELRRTMEESLDAGDRLAPTLLNKEQERVLRAELFRAEAAIQLARAMPNYPYGRYPVKWTKDYVSTLLPHVHEPRHVAQLMKYDARLRAHENDLAGALHDVKAALYASRAVGDEETLISQLVRISVDTAAVRILESSMACGRASERDLLDLQKEFELEAQTPYFLTGIRGERGFLNDLLENLQQGEVTFAEYRRLMTGMTGRPIPGMPISSTVMAELNCLRMYVNLRFERGQMLHYMNTLIEAAKLPTWEQTDALDAQEKELLKDPPVWAAIAANTSKVSLADLRAKAALRTAYTALALERFNLAKGRWPDKLDELVPHYLATVPLDPFDGAPLRLARKGSALIVYSISEDKVDQGGVMLATPSSAGSDLGFVLLDPSQRRKAGKAFQFPPHPPQEPPVVDQG